MLELFIEKLINLTAMDIAAGAVVVGIIDALIHLLLHYRKKWANDDQSDDDNPPTHSPPSDGKPEVETEIALDDGPAVEAAFREMLDH